MASLQPNQYIKLAQSLPPRLTRFLARYPPPSILPSPTTTTISASPFEATKHPITQKWRDPAFSLRRQADLVKMARIHGVEELLPVSIKSTSERIRRRTENGLRVKGTGVGQKVKGKESERTMKGRLEKRRQAMLEMPQMVQTWKERGHGRGWKKWPK